ncbi:hypothetical protein [Paenibacillus tuaregi]|uniref:hypothetical protein n=1 Tax=Paenibacillus tuaregi TaxID=1816681 RepID=UPI000838BD32|nr:hypothetical protein [Paenibacillus tuaregi]
MKHIRVIFSLISIFLGIIIITVSKIVEEFAVQLGRAAFQAAAAGLYSPQDYEMNLSLNYWLGSLCIIGGFIFLFGDLISKYMRDVRNAAQEFNNEHNGSNPNK